MAEIQTTLSLCTLIAELAIWAIILWFVCPWIGMSPNATQIVRALIVAIAIIVSANAIIGTYGGGSPARVSSPGYLSTPSIIAPERR